MELFDPWIQRLLSDYKPNPQFRQDERAYNKNMMNLEREWERVRPFIGPSPEEIRRRFTPRHLDSNGDPILDEEGRPIEIGDDSKGEEPMDNGVEYGEASTSSVIQDEEYRPVKKRFEGLLQFNAPPIGPVPEDDIDGGPWYYGFTK